MAAAQIRKTGRPRARITRRDTRTAGADRSPANKLQTPRTGGGGRTPTSCKSGRDNAHGREAKFTKKYIYIPRSKRNFSTVCGSKDTGPGRLRASEVEARRARCSSNRRRQSGRLVRRTGSRMARELRGGWWRGRGTAAAKNALSNTQKRPRSSYLKQSKSQYSGHYSELVYNFK